MVYGDGRSLPGTSPTLNEMDLREGVIAVQYFDLHGLLN
jgi:hypothetical protein